MSFVRLFVVFFTAVAATACGDDPCDAVARGRRLAGTGATDCGLAGSDAESPKVTDCARRAKADGKAYSAAYQRKGLDSTLLDVFVETKGERWFLESDDITKRLTPNGNPTVVQQTCTSIELVTDGGARPGLDCQVPSAPETICR